MAIALELLDPKDHGVLRMRSAPQPAPHFVQIVVSEFAAAAATCPILFTKNPANGQFYAGAMFGFKPGENLLAGEESVFRPLDFERRGFFVADENIAIDPEHPRFSDKEGDALFDADGQPGERLRDMQRVLGRLKAGVDETDAFIRALLEHRLIEAIDISLRFDDGETLALQGLYTISLDSLHELDDMAVLALFRRGYLQLAYIMIASLKQVPALAHRRNRRLTLNSE